MKLYHGSNSLFEEISLAKSRDKRDFGRGFYTTTIRRQAELWASSLYERYAGSGIYLYIFEYVPNPILRTRVFDGLTQEWLDMVKDNRINGGLQHNFDIVKGPVANDNTMPTIALYVDGTLSAEATLLQLAYFKANDQVSFHTNQALQTISFIERVSL